MADVFISYAREDRSWVEMLAEECARWSNVEVTLFRGLLVDFCAANDIQVISKGLRGSDFGYELQMAQMNHAISGVDTLFIPSASSHSFLASKLIREIARFGGDVESMVPPPVAKRLAERFT